MEYQALSLPASLMDDNSTTSRPALLRRAKQHRRSANACGRCRFRKVRCDVTSRGGLPCTNCSLDQCECFSIPRKKVKEAKRQKLSDDHVDVGMPPAIKVPITDPDKYIEQYYSQVLIPDTKSTSSGLFDGLSPFLQAGAYAEVVPDAKMFPDSRKPRAATQDLLHTSTQDNELSQNAQEACWPSPTTEKSPVVLNTYSHPPYSQPLARSMLSFSSAQHPSNITISTNATVLASSIESLPTPGQHYVVMIVESPSSTKPPFEAVKKRDASATPVQMDHKLPDQMDTPSCFPSPEGSEVCSMSTAELRDQFSEYVTPEYFGF